MFMNLKEIEIPVLLFPYLVLI